MDKLDFVEFKRDLFKECDRTQQLKGEDYTLGDNNAFANFVDGGERLAISKYKVWNVYADKHWKAITNFCKNDGSGVESEPIRGRIVDMITYLTLLAGMVRDDEMEEHNEGMVV